MKIWKAILATLVIFCAGVFAGVRITEIRGDKHLAALGRSWSPRSGNRPSASTNNLPGGTNHDGRLNLPFGNRPPFRNMGKEFLERLDHELHLDADQRKRVEKILDDSQKKNRDLWKQIEPEIREEMKKSRDLLREVLTPDQNKRWDELMKRPGKPSKEGPSTNSLPAPPPAGLSSNPPPPPPGEPPQNPPQNP